MSYTQQRIVSDNRIYILYSDTNRTMEKLKVSLSLSWGQSQAMQRLPRTLAK